MNKELFFNFNNLWKKNILDLIYSLLIFIIFIFLICIIGYSISNGGIFRKKEKQNEKSFISKCIDREYQFDISSDSTIKLYLNNGIDYIGECKYSEIDSLLIAEEQ